VTAPARLQGPWHPHRCGCEHCHRWQKRLAELRRTETDPQGKLL
jgi:hypothetical protein